MTESLPFVDEHSQPISASPDAVWAALGKVLRGMNGAPFARILGCDPATASPAFAGRPGDTVPGFRVVAADAKQLALRGSHRFSSYELTFELDGDQLRARTHAAFPGVLGKLYRAAVIGTGAHAIVTRRMLRKIARAA